MAFLFRFLACCQSSKSVENEREGQEFRLTSPRFAVSIPQNVHGNHKFATNPSPKEANHNLQNDQTFNQGDISVHLESPNLKAAAEPNYASSQNISFQNLQDLNQEESTNKEGKENTGRFENQNLFNDQSFGEKEKSELQPFTLQRSDPERRSKFATENKEQKSENNESKTTIGGFLVMNKIKRAEEDAKNKDAPGNGRKNVSREVLNSTPPMRPVGKAI